MIRARCNKRFIAVKTNSCETLLRTVRCEDGIGTENIMLIRKKKGTKGKLSHSAHPPPPSLPHLHNSKQGRIKPRTWNHVSRYDYLWARRRFAWQNSHNLSYYLGFCWRDCGQPRTNLVVSVLVKAGSKKPYIHRLQKLKCHNKSSVRIPAILMENRTRNPRNTKYQCWRQLYVAVPLR